MIERIPAKCISPGCLKRAQWKRYCHFHWARLDPENVWNLPTKKTSKDGTEFKPLIETPTPVYGSRTYWDEELKKKVTVSFPIATAVREVIDSCAGDKECFWYLNRGLYCKKHATHPSSST